MERVVSKRYRLLKYLLMVNVLFWLIMGLWAIGRFAFLEKGSLNVALLMFCAFLLYGLGVWMIRNRWPYSKLLVFCYAFGMAMLSLMDELGVLDLLSFVLSILVAVVVVSLWMAEKRKESIRRSAVED